MGEDSQQSVLRSVPLLVLVGRDVIRARGRIVCGCSVLRGRAHGLRPLLLLLIVHQVMALLLVRCVRVRSIFTLLYGRRLVLLVLSYSY